ncbi:NUDIX hydrolase [Rudaeicoccus suwonensis]|uniref:NrtR DNA-binding winged helix domain-containing protein n=1 Tax=Rudaeicoccus suwonensis TaxID=657409 RepID=A0A561E9R9_9MICO|nr:hypothetical protein [Rudaeicoccus suwonensis]TWE12356.1 hypothetical protein BKA23_1159 [Rudaeicoccus suwonensis]
MTHRAAELRAELVAVVLTVAAGRAWVLASGDPAHLPAGPLGADQDSLQTGARDFVLDQTGLRLGYVEQLYTFADGARSHNDDRVVSISYLGLTKADASTGDGEWSALYDLLPWEDRRHVSEDAPVDRLSQEIEAALRRWAGSDRERSERCKFLFGCDDQPWRPDLALQRYELLWEAELVAESPSAARVSALTGAAMWHDHRRILATALSRVRAKLQYRPVVFELMDDTFTLGQLQETVETIAGQSLHKQNFRRTVEVQHELVEPTDELSRDTGGRPARMYRFRREVLHERGQVGTKLPLPRSPR